MKRECGSCEYLKSEKSLIPGYDVYTCFITGEIKEKNGYCTKREYYQPKGE